MSRRRVAVTGLGAVTPAGLEVSSTWKALTTGASAVEYLGELAAVGCRSRIAARVRGYDPQALVARGDPSRLGRSVQFALGAAIEAWRDARLAPGSVDPTRCGTILGSGFGDLAETFHQTAPFASQGRRGVNPAYVPRAMSNASAANLSLEFGLRGPSFVVGSACAASAHAIGLALRAIRYGDGDLVLAGGTEEILCPLAACAFDALHALSTRNEAPARASRPFDRGRDGFVIGEGAAILVLEEWRHAVRRNATIYAELAGFGMTSEACHLTAPDRSGDGAARAMTSALADAQRAPQEVGYVHAHGTSTLLNDVMETRAIHAALGTFAPGVAVSSSKSMIGHLLGAAAAVSVVATVLALHDAVLPPTINQEEADPECDLDYVPNVARSARVELALVNAFAFGGHCVSLALQQPA